MSRKPKFGRKRIFVCGQYGDDFYFLPLDRSMDTTGDPAKDFHNCPYPQNAMISLLPKEFSDKFGKIDYSFDGDILLVLSPKDQRAMIQWLRAAGHKVVPCNAAIEAACD